MAIQCVAVLDVGTTAVKACLFSQELRLLSRASQEYALQTAPGRAEVSPDVYLSAIRRALERALSQAPICQPCALCVTTQGETLTLLDQDNRPLRPLIVWLDARAEAQAHKLRARIAPDTFHQTTGLPQIDGALPLAKLLYLKEEEPERFHRARHVVLLEDYLLYFMTGRLVSDRSLQSSTGWFDIMKDTLWDEALAAVGVSETLLPELIEPGECAGALTKSAAQFLGLQEGLPVFAGAMDQVAAAFALGGVREGAITETTGTALVLSACTLHPLFTPEHRVTVYRHARSGRYLYVLIGNTAGMALKWFRDTFCHDFSEGYQALDRLAAAIQPGCDGLTFLPFLNGSVDPDTCPSARAMFSGAGLSTTRAHFVRAVLESVAFLEKDLLTMLDRLGCSSEKIYALGGGAQSALWMNIKADACEKTFLVPSCKEATALGAAMLALKKEPNEQTLSFENFAVYQPDPSTSTLYETAYRRYQQLYAAMKSLTI